MKLHFHNNPIANIIVLASIFSCTSSWANPIVQSFCPQYQTSDPIVVNRNKQIIQNLIITSTNGPGITVNGYSGVKIHNVVIHHNHGTGITLVNAALLKITNADIIFEGAPLKGANASYNNNNIDCYNSDNLTVRNVRLTRGSSGIYMDHCTRSRLSLIEGHDQRGPFPRGELIQWNNSNNGVLTDFSNENSLVNSWTEDNLNIYQSRYITIKRGLLDTNNSPTGDGIMVDNNSGNVLVQDVDAIHQSNGCFGIYGGGGHDVTFTHTRCRDTVCKLPRGKPSSNSLAWTIDPLSVYGNLNIKNSFYTNLCNKNDFVWDTTKLSINQIKKQNFRPRPPLRVKLCKYGY